MEITNILKQHTDILRQPDDAVARVRGTAAPDPLPAMVPQPAAPDLPSGVGAMIFAAYAMTMIGFLLFFAGSHEAVFMVAVGFFYLAVYAAVPFVFFRIQPHATKRPTWSRFRDRGLDTWTGHLSSRQALFQILGIPVALALAVLGIGIVYLIVR